MSADPIPSSALGTYLVEERDARADRPGWHVECRSSDYEGAVRFAIAVDAARAGMTQRRHLLRVVGPPDDLNLPPAIVWANFDADVEEGLL